MKVKLFIDKEQNKIFVDLLDNDGNTLQSHEIDDDELNGFDFEKFKKFLKIVEKILNHLIKTYCKIE